MGAECRFALEGCGVQCVMITGTSMRLVLSAGN